MKRYTNYADRQEIIELNQQGYSYCQIAQQTGWSYETVRQVCRKYKRQGEAALQPQRVGRPATGPLSTFDPIVRFAALRLKLKHPGWGPDIVCAELAKQTWAHRIKLPRSSSVGTYFSQFGERLVAVRSHKQLPQAQPLAPALQVVHGCWQMDADERVDLPGFGLAHILNIVDHVSGIKIGSFLFPAHRDGRRCRVSWPQMQEALRQAFTRWGLPDRIRTDRDRVIVPGGDYPFPKLFTLWLAGLGIEHELIHRVTQNGCVERSHRTWEGRLTGYGPFNTLEDWQVIVDYERWRMNAILPSRGRHCRRRPPLVVYPQARTPRRWYRCQDELALFDLEQVHRYLAQGKWLRHTSSKGQFSLNNQKFCVGTAYKRRWVLITFVPEVGFQVSCPPDPKMLKTIEVTGLTISDIIGLQEGV